MTRRWGAPNCLAGSRVVARLLLAGFLTCGLGLIAPADAQQLTRFTYREMHMGVEVRIVLYAPDSASARSAGEAGFDRIAELNRIFSSYRSSSELSAVNRNAGGPPVEVAPELFYVLHRSLALSAATDGAFDVTVGPLSELWARARREERLPGSKEIARLDSLVGWRLVELDPVHRTVRLRREGMQLDLGAVAKGYVLDEALETLARRGIDRALVDAGGDVAVGAPPPGEEGWTISLAPGDPVRSGPSTRSGDPARVGDPARSKDPARSVAEDEPRSLVLAHAAVATSGDTQQFVEIGGTRYSHIVDPRTGRGLTHRLAVTVVAPTGLAADAYATAVSVLGPEEGRAFLDRRPGARGYLRRLDR